MKLWGNKNHKHTRRQIACISACALVFALLASGCGEEDAAAGADPNDAAMQSAIAEMIPDAEPTGTSRVLQIERSEALPFPTPIAAGTGTVSISDEAPELDVKSDDPTPTPTPDPDENKEDEKDPNKTGNGTPLVFSVGDATYVAYGAFDETMEGEILNAINVYRLRGNLKPVEPNMSLEFCADTRSRESTLCFNHTRPNGSLWYTVAPAYYKAELLAKDYGTAKDTVDAWMSTATGRQYLLNPDLLSIGISVFKHDGRNFIVAGLGD